MARREKEMNKEEGTEQPWGTLEELLLACAVNRHGPKRWESIAMELQTRTSHHHLRAFYSPPSCKRKYHELRLRFTDGDGGDDEESLNTMVDELKKLRVAELRREVERHDVSIEFLQLKVKRLEEEREQSFKPKEEIKKEETDLSNRPERNYPQEVAGISVSDEDSYDRDNRSFNESNSTSNQNRAHDGDKPELKNEPNKPECRETKREPVQTGSKPISDCSLTLKLTDAVEEERGNGFPDELCDSVAESKREGEAIKEGTKQSSEVQSPRKKKRHRRSRFPIASSSGEEEPEGDGDGDEVSLAAKQIALKSQPLMKILVSLRSHKNGSLFQRRLRSQETEKYKKMIRQHMDLETVQSKLEKGLYVDSHSKLFRDLLLLFNNAIIFFPNSSPQHMAARELRELVTKDMARTIFPKSDPVRKQQPGPFPARLNKVAAAVAPPPPPPPPPPTIVVCRRRSSSSTATSAAARAPSEVPNKTREVETKLKQLETKQQHSNRSLSLTGKKKLPEEKSARKQGMKERPELLSKRINPRTSNKVRDIKNQSEDNDGDDDHNHNHNDDELETRVKTEESMKKKKKKKKKKKQGVSGNYLKRILKQNSTTPKVVEEDSNDDDSDVRKIEKEEKNRRNIDVEGRKERRKRRKDGRREQEEREEGERNGRGGKRGRPLKRSPVATDLGRRDVGRGGKRVREGGGSSEMAADSRKRSRKKVR